MFACMLHNKTKRSYLCSCLKIYGLWLSPCLRTEFVTPRGHFQVNTILISFNGCFLSAMQRGMMHPDISFDNHLYNTKYTFRDLLSDRQSMGLYHGSSFQKAQILRLIIWLPRHFLPWGPSQAHKNLIKSSIKQSGNCFQHKRCCIVI